MCVVKTISTWLVCGLGLKPGSFCGSEFFVGYVYPQMGQRLQSRGALKVTGRGYSLYLIHK